MEKYENALVLGKFMDFHKGHEALINFALTKAKKVTVLLCITATDRVSPLDRFGWISNTFGTNVKVKIFDYQTYGLSNKEESDRTVSKAWAKELKKHKYLDFDVIIGSEDYITYVGEYYGSASIIFDKERKQFHCSSTTVNEGDFQYRTQESKFKLVKKIAFVGPESTGKSTAAQKASKKFNLDLVHESARDLINEDGSYSLSDLNIFALAQQLEINKTIKKTGKPFILVDSTALTTLMYSRMKFGSVSSNVQYLFDNEDMDLYILFSPEVGFVQDGTRQMEEYEERLQYFYNTLTELKSKNLPYVVVSGEDYNDRYAQVIKIIKERVEDGNFKLSI